MKARPLSILRQLFSHKLEPGDCVELDAEESGGRLGYVLLRDGNVKSVGVMPAELNVPDMTVEFSRGDLELLSKIAWACDDLSFTTRDPGLDIEGHPHDSSELVRAEAFDVHGALRQLHDAIPGVTTKYKDTHARALEAGVMVDPGYYWAKAHEGSKWVVGRVLSYESICGPAGTVWHGNEVVPVADLHQLGHRITEPSDATPSLHPGTKPYRPPMKRIAWPASRRAEITVEQWNDQCPVGTPVRYWPVAGVDEAYDTRTRSEAWALGHGEAVVKVHGWSGGLALSHIQKLAHIERKDDTTT